MRSKFLIVSINVFANSYVASDKNEQELLLRDNADSMPIIEITIDITPQSGNITRSFLLSFSKADAFIGP